MKTFRYVTMAWMVAGVLASTSVSWAQTRWIGGAGGAPWDVGGNWDNGLPSASVNAYVGHSGGASPVSAVITQNVAAATKDCFIGDSTVGTLAMSGGRLDVAGRLAVGARTAGSSAPVGNGTMIQNGGEVVATGSLYLPNIDYPDSSGRYELNGGSLSISNLWLYQGTCFGTLRIADGATFIARSHIYVEGWLEFPAGATVDLRGSIGVPHGPGVQGTVTQRCHIALNGNNSLQVGDINGNSSGTYHIVGCSLGMWRLYMARSLNCVGILNITANGAMRVGNGVNAHTSELGDSTGRAEINLGDAASTGWLEPDNSKTSLLLRKGANASAVLRGVGGIRSNNFVTVIQNGRVIADAWGGAERDLDLTRITTITNGLPNGTSESNGWYAVNGARLILPPKTVATGSPSYNFGEHDSETAIDLVNSVRFGFTGVTTGGGLTNRLLAVERSEVPHRESLDRPVAVYHVASAPALAFGSVALTFRYDSLACDAAGYETPVVLHSVGGGRWQELSVTPDAANRRVTVTLSDLSGSDYFALAASLRSLGTVVSVQ